MDYERIHKVQSGIISPSKLRMKLMVPHHQRNKDGSNCNSARTSPSKLEDSEFAKNSLLASQPYFDDEEAHRVEASSISLSSEAAGVADQGSKSYSQSMESLQRQNGDASSAKLQLMSKGDGGISVHPFRMLEDDNLDYDSNASNSSFEFHKGERSMRNSVLRSLSRPMPSKWNDAEKWILNRQNQHANYPKRNVIQNQTNRLAGANTVRVAPESTSYDPKSSAGRGPETKRVDFCHPASQLGTERFSFVPSGMQLTLGGPTDTCHQTEDLKEVGQVDLSCNNQSNEEATGIPTIRSVQMRDMGTEMTPATSLEPSRTATPVDATTPLRSPTSSIPSTPRRVPAPTPTEHMIDDELQCQTDNSRKELSEEELKLKTRREIVALGVQLGKMNIAAWASKEEQEKNKASEESFDSREKECIEFQKRATEWEEVEKSKHTARYKREEIKIHAWESQQKAKLEAEMQRIEAQVEQIRAQAKAKLLKKIASTRQRSENKRAAAEARKNRDAERTAAQAEHIRQTGRMPSSHQMCCCWL